jgi:hypothetical protein
MNGKIRCFATVADSSFNVTVFTFLLPFNNNTQPPFNPHLHHPPCSVQIHHSLNEGSRLLHRGCQLCHLRAYLYYLTKTFLASRALINTRHLRPRQSTRLDLKDQVNSLLIALEGPPIPQNRQPMTLHMVYLEVCASRLG